LNVFLISSRNVKEREDDSHTPGSAAHSAIDGIREASSSNEEGEPRPRFGNLASF